MSSAYQRSIPFAGACEGVEVIGTGLLDAAAEQSTAWAGQAGTKRLSLAPDQGGRGRTGLPFARVPL